MNLNLDELATTAREGFNTGYASLGQRLQGKLGRRVRELRAANRSGRGLTTPADQRLTQVDHLAGHKNGVSNAAVGVLNVLDPINNLGDRVPKATRPRI